MQNKNTGENLLINRNFNIELIAVFYYSIIHFNIPVFILFFLFFFLIFFYETCVFSLISRVQSVSGGSS